MLLQIITMKTMRYTYIYLMNGCGVMKRYRIHTGEIANEFLCQVKATYPHIQIPNWQIDSLCMPMPKFHMN